MSKSTQTQNTKPKATATKTITKKSGKSLIPEKYQDFAYCAILVLAVLVFYSSAIFGVGFNASDNLASESFKTYLNEANKSGKFPLWIPYIFSGMPAYSSLLLTGDRYWDFIPKIIFGITNFIGQIFSNDAARVVSFYMIYAIGMYLLIKQKGLEKVSAFFGAFAATFSTSIVVWAMIGHNTKPVVLCFLPFIFLLADKLKQKFSLLNSVLLAIVVHLMLTGAHLQMIFYSACAIGIYFVVEVIASFVKKENLMDILRPIGILAVCGALAFALSADRFLATREYTPYSTRGSAPIQQDVTRTKTDASGGNSYDYATSYSFAPSEMMQFIVPNYNGFGKTNFKLESNKELKYIPQMVHEDKLNLYWGQKQIEDAPPYMGIIIFFFGLVGLYLNRKNSFAWFLGALSFFALLLSFGNYFPLLYNLFYYNFPSFNKFRAPSMVLAMMQFAMPVLAAMGLNKFLNAKEEEQKDVQKGGLILLGMTGLYFVAGLINMALGKQSYYAAIDNSRLAMQMQPEYKQMGVLKEFQDYLWAEMSSEWLLLGVLAVIASLAIYMMQKNKLNKQIALGVVIILTAFDLFRMGWMPMPSAKETSISDSQFSPKDYYEFVKKDKDLFRIVDFTAAPNVAAFYKLQSVNGYHSAKLRVYQDMLDVASGGSTSDVRNPFLWNLLNVKYIITSEPLPVEFEPEFRSQQGQIYVYRNSGYMPRMYFVNKVEVAKPIDILNKFKYKPEGQGFSPFEVAYIEKPLSQQIDSNFVGNKIIKTKVEDELMEYDVTTNGNNFMFISEIYYPAGWKAYLDDKEIEIIKTNYAFRGVVIPKGQHKLKFEFKDPAFEKGKTISTATSMLLGLLLIISIVMEFRKRKPSAVEVAEDLETETEV